MSQAVSAVVYNDKKLIPASLVNISKQYQKSSDGKLIGKIYNITLTGTIVAWMGSPKTDKTFWDQPDYPDDEVIAAADRLNAIQRKQEAIRDLFSDEGQCLEIQSVGHQAVQCYPRINAITFTDGIWYDRCEYTIELEADELFPEREDVFFGTGDNELYISDASETWTFETDETPEGIDVPPGTLDLPRTYRLTHSVSAIGKRYYDSNGLEKEAWEQAKEYVITRIGYDATIALSADVNKLPAGYSGYNCVKTENIDKGSGSYEVTETWILAYGVALEQFSVEKNYDAGNPYTTVSINGTITGLEERDSDMAVTTTKYQNATTRFNQVVSLFWTRCNTYSGLTLNTSPLRSVVGYNEIEGVITYSYDYDNRPTIITGARSVNISVVDNLTGQQFASVFVLGRTKGPVLQSLSTTPEKTRTLSIDLIMEPNSFSSIIGDETEPEYKQKYAAIFGLNPRMVSPTDTEILRIIDGVSPLYSIVGYTSYYYHQPQETWNPLTGAYSFNITWTYE